MALARKTGASRSGLPVRVEWTHLPLNGPDRAAIEAEPNDSWQQANELRLGRDIYGSADDVDYLDTADAYSPVSWALARTYARTLYAYQSSTVAEKAGRPAPDLASEPPKISSDGTVYTFTLRKGVKWAPPVNRELKAQDFVYALDRMYDSKTPSSGQPYGNFPSPGKITTGAGRNNSTASATVRVRAGCHMLAGSRDEGTPTPEGGFGSSLRGAGSGFSGMGITGRTGSATTGGIERRGVGSRMVISLSASNTRPSAKVNCAMTRSLSLEGQTFQGRMIW